MHRSFVLRTMSDYEILKILTVYQSAVRKSGHESLKSTESDFEATLRSSVIVVDA